jgi:asparagine synthase (glutamine-hydrolysing)
MSFAFASELKALTNIPQFPKRVNARAVADYLSFHYVPDPDSIYENVSKLPAGHSLTIGAGPERPRRYWQPEFVIDSGADFHRSVEEVRSLAEDAVASRMVSDVPIGGFLSGGVDSSAVVAFMAQRAPEQVNTFSIGFTDKRYDELDFARQVAGRYRTAHREEVVSPSIHDVLDTLLEHYDEPFGDSSAIPTLYLSEMTRRHVTVALSGDGADEVFGGYRRYAMACMEDRMRRLFPAWFRRTVIKAGGRYYPKFDYLPRVFRAKTTLAGISEELGAAYYNTMSWFRGAALEAIQSPELKRALAGYAPRERFIERFRRVAHLPPLQQLQAVDFETYLPGDILVKVDRATMAHSLESRAPWLDHRLVEAACRLPASFKLRGHTGKYIFKEAVRPHLPPDIITRKKMGFAVPLKLWFRTSLKPVFESLVLREEMAALILLEEARRVWREHQTGLHDHSSKLWNLLMLAGWQARHGAASREGLAACLAERQALCGRAPR